MNDDIERFNEENRKLNQGPMPGNFSQAEHSSITSPDEDNRSIAEGIIQDLSNQRIDIDATKQDIATIGVKLEQIIIALNNIAQGTIQPTQTPEQGKMNMETLSALGDFAEKAIGAYKSFKGNDSVTDSFTQQITENAKAEAIESLNIVHLINKKVKGKLVADIAGDIAGNVINDSSKPSHEPQ